MRKSFNGLGALARERLVEEPRQGALVVFTNRKRTQLKTLYLDGGSLWLLIKRLEKGAFSWPRSGQVEGVKLRLAPEVLAMLVAETQITSSLFRIFAI
jgi:transposase